MITIKTEEKLKKIIIQICFLACKMKSFVKLGNFSCDFITNFNTSLLTLQFKGLQLTANS